MNTKNDLYVEDILDKTSIGLAPMSSDRLRIDQFFDDELLGQMTAKELESYRS